MARLITTGAEANDATIEGYTTSGTTSIDTGTVRTGARSFKTVEPAAGNSFFQWAFTGAAVTVYYLRFYVNFPSIPTTANWVYVAKGSGANDWSLDLSGVVQGNLELTAGGVSTNVARTISTGVWYRVEIGWSLNSGTNTDTIQMRLDDEVVYDNQATGLTVNAAPTNFQLGTMGRAVTAYFDDVALNDSTGQAQNGFPGNGKVTLHLPISDVLRDTLWTGGAAGTTNLWDAVNNTPPAGLASASATNTSQIEHAGGAAASTDTYQAALTTPANAGIAAGDIAKVASFIEVDGEDIATGTKLLNFQVSGPSIPSPGNVTAGNDAGAVGTYPTTWAVRTNQGLAYNLGPLPSATSPQMIVKRPETAARVASVCFMGLSIDSGPEVVANLYNTFEGGSNGTTISTANSGGDSGNAFNVVTISATAAAVFDNAHTLQGSALAAKLLTGGTAGNADLDWTTSLATVGTTIYARLYLYATANPGTLHRIWAALPAAGAHCISQMTTTGKLNILNSGGGAIATSTNSISLNQWVRIEYSAEATATGTVTAKLYNNADSTVATETISGANSGGTTQIVKSVFGISGTTVANVGPIWMDGLAAGNPGGFFGPIGLPDLAMAPHRAP